MVVEMTKDLTIEDKAELAERVKTTFAPGEIVIGQLLEINQRGEPCIDFPGNPQTKNLVAMSTTEITTQHIGKQVALLFNNGQLDSPVIMGVIHNPLDSMLENFEQNQLAEKENNSTESEKLALQGNLKVDDVLIDGNKITFEAHEQIVLKCGESSITLTKAGKILIRGKYLLNRSTGVNRIMGGSVQVN